jgi:hypothetical protein
MHLKVTKILRIYLKKFCEFRPRQLDSLLHPPAYVHRQSRIVLKADKAKCLGPKKVPMKDENNRKCRNYQ